MDVTNPPKKAQINGDTYPIGSTREVGSGIASAIAVLKRSKQILIANVNKRERRVDFKVVLSAFFGAWDFGLIFLFFIFPPSFFKNICVKQEKYEKSGIDKESNMV